MRRLIVYSSQRRRMLPTAAARCESLIAGRGRRQRCSLPRPLWRQLRADTCQRQVKLWHESWRERRRCAGAARRVLGLRAVQAPQNALGACLARSARLPGGRGMQCVSLALCVRTLQSSQRLSCVCSPQCASFLRNLRHPSLRHRQLLCQRNRLSPTGLCGEATLLTCICRDKHERAAASTWRGAPAQSRRLVLPSSLFPSSRPTSWPR